jgi:hypothetical protein
LVRHLPRALEFELVGNSHISVTVDGHVFICEVAADASGITRRRVKRGGRRAFRKSGYYEQAAFEFAWREAFARGLVTRDLPEGWKNGLAVPAI